MRFSPEDSLAFINFDSISTWNFATTDEWTDGKSKWTIAPPSGEMYVYDEVKVLLSQTAVLSKSIFIEFWIPGINEPVKTVVYKGRIDLAVRAETVDRINHSCNTGNDLTEDFHVYTVRFAEDVLLWSTAGLDEDGVPKMYGEVGDLRPKLGSMTMRIEDDVPLGGQMAKCRYHIDKYEDVEVTE